MHKIQTVVLKYCIFPKLGDIYIPVLRLVCKRWSKILENDKTSIFQKIRDSLTISYSYIKILIGCHNFTSHTMNLMYETIICKKSFKDKINILEFLWNKRCDVQLESVIGKVSDSETATLLYKYYGKPLFVSLECYSKDIILYHKTMNYDVYYNVFEWNREDICLEELISLRVGSNVTRAVYAMFDMLEPIINKIKKFNCQTILSCAIKYKSIRVINYIISIGGLIRPCHYDIIFKGEIDDMYVDYIMSLDNNKYHKCTKFDKFPLKFFVKYCKQHNIEMTPKLLYDSILSNRTDLCEYIYNVLEDVSILKIHKNENITRHTLQWLLKKGFVL